MRTVIKLRERKIIDVTYDNSDKLVADAYAKSKVPASFLLRAIPSPPRDSKGPPHDLVHR